jgi:cytochrome c-type biogenesis protein CcmH
VTVFVLLCALMVCTAIAVVARPLLKKSNAASGSRSIVAVVTITLLVPSLAAGLYMTLSQWDWNNPEAGKPALQQPNIDEMVARLEARLKKSPEDINGWLMLGRSYLTLQRPAQAVAAYQKAYDLGGEMNVDATLGLAQALVMADESAFEGRAGDLFEAALKREPGNSVALWYGAITALSRGDHKLGRQRIETLLAMNPPEKIRVMLERQLQDIDQQLGVQSPQKEVAAKPQRQVTVKVSMAATLHKDIDPRTPLFILARDGAGPPLAAVRRAVGDLPLTVTLSDRDAMIAGRSIAAVKQFDVVARIAKGGSPQAQSGDLFGEYHYHGTSPDKDVVEIVIDRVTP